MSIFLLNSEIKRLASEHPHVSIQLLEHVALKQFSESCTVTLQTEVLPVLNAYAQSYTNDIAKDQREASQ